MNSVILMQEDQVVGFATLQKSNLEDKTLTVNLLVRTSGSKDMVSNGVLDLHILEKDGIPSLTFNRCKGNIDIQSISIEGIYQDSIQFKAESILDSKGLEV